MKIHVTQDDIDNGQQGSPSRCPVARAIRRETQDKHFIYVGRFSITYDYKAIETPLSVHKFIEKFDIRRKVEPFNFILKV